jgi:hypothetical protein
VVADVETKVYGPSIQRGRGRGAFLFAEYQLELPCGAGAPPVTSPPPTALRRDSWRTDECKVRLYGLPEDRRPVQSVHCCLGFSVRLVFDQCIALLLLGS